MLVLQFIYHVVVNELQSKHGQKLSPRTRLLAAYKKVKGKGSV